MVARAGRGVRGAVVPARRCAAATTGRRRRRPHGGVGNRARTGGQRARAPDPSLTGRGSGVRVGRTVTPGPAPSTDRTLARVRELVQLPDLLSRQRGQSPLHGRDSRHARRCRLATRCRTTGARPARRHGHPREPPRRRRTRGRRTRRAAVLEASALSNRTPRRRSTLPRRRHGRRRAPTPTGSPRTPLTRLHDERRRMPLVHPHRGSARASIPTSPCWRSAPARSHRRSRCYPRASASSKRSCPPSSTGTARR